VQKYGTIARRYSLQADESRRATYRIELIWHLFGTRFWIRRDGKYSEKLPEATATQIADELRKWLRKP